MSDKKSPPPPHAGCGQVSLMEKQEFHHSQPSANKASPSPVPLHLNPREKKERKSTLGQVSAEV